MKKLYLHIGTPKTGTSALQSFFSKNREQLYRDGIWYPNLVAELKVEEKLKIFTGNGVSLKEYAVNLDLMDENKKDFFKGMFEDLHQSEKDILLSDELLYDCDEILYSNLMKAGFDLNVIVFLRRQDLWAESRWNQMVKWGSCADSCYDTAQKLNMDYYQKMKKIAEIIGKENLIIRLYQSGERDIFEDFLNILEINNIENYQKDKYQANPSLSANYVEMKRILNAIPGSDILMEDAKELLEEGRHYSLTEEKVKNAPAFLKREERIAILDKYCESNTALAQEFFGRDRLFDEITEDGDESGVDINTIYQDIIKFFSMLSVHQYQEVEKLKNHVLKFQIPEECEEKRIVVYGIDRLGNKLYQQIKMEGKSKDIVAVDRRWEMRQAKYEIPVINPENVDYAEQDYVMIAVGNEKTYLAIREYLIGKKRCLLNVF